MIKHLLKGIVITLIGIIVVLQALGSGARLMIQTEFLPGANWFINPNYTRLSP